MKKNVVKENVEFQDVPYSDETIFNVFNPLMRDWWTSNFKEFSPPQKFSIVNIHNRVNTLISSPTGSGKTLSAFAAIINELVSLKLNDALEDKTYCIYISPLKALGNDIEKNLHEPLDAIDKIFKEKTGKGHGIRVGIRTGDTSTSDKAKMLRKPPHIIITTPESLAIMLTTIKLREKLEEVDWVIVDEVHALADNKRGTHLSISLERLAASKDFCRIGLSATVSPLRDVALFLVGYEDPDNDVSRPCKIVDVNYIKRFDLRVLSPVPSLIDSSFAEIHSNTYSMLDNMIQSHRTTLIFTNTRSATERVVHHLKDRFPKNYASIENGFSIGAHHGSLSQDSRLKIENRLKKGELKAVVSSTSLELGIDIGFIDLVVLLGSPKSVARALQRIGRSGHKLHEESKGRILAMDRDDLVECSVLLKAANDKKIDKISIPKNVFDVLAQQVFGLALEDKIKITDAFNLVRKSYPFKDLDKKDFVEILKYLSGEFVSLEERNVYAKIWVDKETLEMGKRGKMARVIYMTNVGTIPDETNVKVKLGEEYIGSISEPFLERLKKGDVFVLGGQTYEFRHALGMTAFVNSSVNRPPTVPSWYSEMLPLSFDLALEIQKFRRLMNDNLEAGYGKEQVIDFINSYLYVDKLGAESIYDYFKQQFDYALIPHDKRLLVEHYDDGKKKYIVFHSLYGRRTNDVLSRALAFTLSKIHKRDVEININDNGFYLVLPRDKPIQVMRAFGLLKDDNIRDLMKHALDKTEVLGRRFRHCAARALMILRNYKGRNKSVSRQQMNSRLLISAVRRVSNDFIILREARREVLEDLMDINSAEIILKDIISGKLEVKEIFTEIPSPFAFNLISMGYSDIMKMEDKQTFLKNMHNQVLAKISLKQRK